MPSGRRRAGRFSLRSSSGSDYGAFKLQEFGAQRPFWYVQGPRPEHIVSDNGAQAALSRGGLLVLTEWASESFPITRAAALAVARALRPVPSG
jgi:hypothetical protein